MLHVRSNPVVAAEMLTFRSRGDRSGCHQGRCAVHDRTAMTRFWRWCRAPPWQACQYPTSLRRHRLPTPQSIGPAVQTRSEEHTSELQSLMRISNAAFGLKKNIKTNKIMNNCHTVTSTTQAYT